MSLYTISLLVVLYCAIDFLCTQEKLYDDEEK